MTNQLVSTSVERLEEYRNGGVGKDLSEDIGSIKESLKDQEEYIHKENVRVYRNVQAIVEKGQQRDKEEFKELANKLEAIQVAVETKNNALMPLTIITMILVIADIVINVLRVLGIL